MNHPAATYPASLQLTGYVEGTGKLISALSQVSKAEPRQKLQFYDMLAKLEYSSREVVAAQEYFRGLAEGIVRRAGI